MLRKENTLDFDSNDIKTLTKESIASLSFSLIQHKRKYNVKIIGRLSFFWGFCNTSGILGCRLFSFGKKILVLFFNNFGGSRIGM
jgi:hypothetical protein